MNKLVKIGFRLGNKFRFFRKFFISLAYNIESFLLMGYRKDMQIMSFIWKTRKEKRMTVSPGEAYTIYSVARNTCTLKGDMAEVGVFNGATAKIISEAKGKNSLHLFDTFKGLPKPHESDDVIFKGGELAGSLEAVKTYLKNYTNLYYYPGLFPYSADPVKNKVFSFVHLDVDLYESMLSCLEFFYPRMCKGGAILAHDFQFSGVRKAFEEFFPDLFNHIIELPTSHILIIK